MGLFRIWKGDSASLHAARATRPREHLRRAAFFRGAWFWFCGGVGPPHHERGLAGTPRCERAGVYGALRAPNAKRLSSEEGASSQPRSSNNVARGSLFLEGATASGLGQRCFLNNSLTSCFVLWATNACCPLALSGLDLSNPTSLLFDFRPRFFVFVVRGRLPPL